jgi:excisionase family DNA binding protein
MRPTRKCEFCGKTFVPRSGMQKYCSEECQAEAKRLRKKRQQDLINGIEPIMNLQHQEYLTFSKAAILMGCTRQYIYKLVANGKLKASRLSSRMAFVRKADIEKMFEGNPYKRVVPVSKSKLSKKAKTEKPTQNQESIKGKEENEVLDYYSGEEVMSIYKVKKSWLYTSAKRNQIPMCRIAGKNYYSKRHIDEFFGTAVDLNSITEWVTADDVGDAFSMSKSALRAYTYRHKIPTKREYGRTYYSKEHLRRKFSCVCTEVLVQGCYKQYLSCRDIDKFCKFLHKIQFLLRIVLSSMFKNLTKFINKYDKETSTLLCMVISVTQFVKHIVGSSVNSQFIAH